MTHQFISVAREGSVTLITLNRPEVLNALHAPASWELHAAFDAFEADPEQWVAILTGTGERAFCAGNDLKHQASQGAGRFPPTGFGGLTSRFDMTKPVIAAVNGHAMGGGFEMALACDLILAAPKATFALPEPAVGLAALGGGLLRLPRYVGLGRAMSLILTGRRISAAAGQQLGFVMEVTARERLLRRAMELAAEICTLSPLSVRASKQVVLAGLDESNLAAATALQGKLPAVQAMVRSRDYLEGPRAFAEKRPPVWRGN